MARGTVVPITPSVLEWAIRDSGHDAAAVAEAAGVSRDVLAAWISGAEKPRLTQFHQLAKFLKRPEAVFFLPQPPETVGVDVQFRSPPGVEKREPSPKERLHIREAARLQRGLAWVLDSLAETPSKFPSLSTKQSPEEAATAWRERLGVAVAAQLQWSNEYEAVSSWRAALERVGIHVLFLPMGEESVQGFSLWHEQVPLLAVNTTRWKATARVFTMFHECAHLLTRTSSLCAKGTSKAWTDGDKIERWCEEFAAAALLPWPAVEQRLSHRYPDWRPGRQITDLQRAAYVATQFKVSLRASVLRLIDKGVASWNLYRIIPPLSDKQVKSGGPPAEEGQGRRPERRVGQYGVRTASTFLRGVRREVISRDDAIRYLDIADSEIDELEAFTVAAG